MLSIFRFSLVLSLFLVISCQKNKDSTVRSEDVKSAPVEPRVPMPTVENTETSQSRMFEKFANDAAEGRPVAAWQLRIKTEAAQFKVENPAAYASVAQLKPRLTRARTLRFISKALVDPRSSAVLLERFLGEDNDSQTKEALVEALGRTSGVYSDAILDLLSKESDPIVRARMVSIMRRSDIQLVQHALRLGLADESPLVRASAAHTLGKVENNPEITQMLVLSLEDPSFAVQEAALRSASIHHPTEANDKLENLLRSSNAEIRLQSLYVISRVAPEILSRAGSLERDSDKNVSQAAIRLRSAAGLRKGIQKHAPE